jgi:glyoxylase-like metal-dependent hydrolase (beta-lactamase superfamily II)
VASVLVTTDPANVDPARMTGGAEEVAPRVFLHSAFVNSYAVETGAGLLLIDPGLANLSVRVRDAVRGWSRSPLHTAVYTHGHVDHAFGLAAWLEDGERPLIIGQENLPARFARYQLTHGYNARINQRQFSLPSPAFPDRFTPPTLLFRDTLSQELGGTRVEYRAAKGETDDHCYVFVPAQGYLFSGDLVIWQAPNCGNPQKVQRYPSEWADALEEMASLDAEWLFPGHGLVVKGRAAVKQLLVETARYLRVLVDQVLERMNRGETPEEIFHAVEPDRELATRPYLRANYDHPKFIVRNLLRLWGGWWNGNAADLLPARFEAQAAEIAALAGGGRAGGARKGAPRGRRPGSGRTPRRVGDARQSGGRGRTGAQARGLRTPRRRRALSDGAGHLSRRRQRRPHRAGPRTPPAAPHRSSRLGGPRLGAFRPMSSYGWRGRSSKSE